MSDRVAEINDLGVKMVEAIVDLFEWRDGAYKKADEMKKSGADLSGFWELVEPECDAKIKTVRDYEIKICDIGRDKSSSHIETCVSVAWIEGANYIIEKDMEYREVMSVIHKLSKALLDA